MSDIAAPPARRSDILVATGLQMLPGIALLVAIGLAGRWCERTMMAWGQAHQIALPDIDYVLWAIVFGLLVSNTVGVPKVCRVGVATSEFWLKVGIVLLGVRFLPSDVLRLGGVSLLLMAASFAMSIVVMTWLGARFGLGGKLTSLLAIGSSVCGVSAIIAARGAIAADDEDAALAIAVILMLGAIGLFTFPLIGHAVGLSDHAFGLWVGLAVDNTAEATAAGAIYSDEAARYAVLAKTTRNATIGFVVLAYALYWAARGEAAGIASKTVFLWRKFPKFVLAFLAVSLLASLHAVNGEQAADLVALSHWAFLVCFAGIGLSTDLRRLTAPGWRPLAVGAVGELVIAAITFALVIGAQATGLL